MKSSSATEPAAQHAAEGLVPTKFWAARQTGGRFEEDHDMQPAVALPPPLSAAEIEHFKTEGYVSACNTFSRCHWPACHSHTVCLSLARSLAHLQVILRGFIDQPVIERWREQFWSAMVGERGQPETWDTERNSVAAGYGAAQLRLEPRLLRVPQMVAAAQQLGDGKLHQLGNGGAIPATTWPSDGEWHPAQGGHVDGYGNPETDWTGGLLLNATTYVEDVQESEGGAFTYWPRTHTPVHRFFNEFPDTIDGSFNNMEPRVSFYHRDPDVMRGNGDGVEFLGQAGDVILWHGFLAHSASKNSNPASPRIACICRWAHEDLYVPNAGQEGLIAEGTFVAGYKAGRTSYATHIPALNDPVRRTEMRYTEAREVDMWRLWGAVVRGAHAGPRL